ncbi:hypothetical protein CYLTODRAFT_432071 [Cylindrobasidium torrendii FP15055 ss-10]|uniref:EXPERA domain-containing protein n=1 Tax=Cylindrobasidium torrendii FP15055 ss-10 TaxID=1314674 RepID=A0A0D7B8H5_9AGAR|nr:hypothetical protein CYLTODRAFT_432071 [Cylindrobasidium torrendii FP15055 ss-10]
MAVVNWKPATWITAWFLLTAPIILWDATYCFMRPRSFEGGDLHWIWEPYSIYQNIDYVYSPEAYAENDGFPNAQSLMNLIETALNLLFVYLSLVAHWPAAPLVGFASALMTLSKTVLYLLNEFYCNFCSIGKLGLRDLIQFYILPNGFWIVVPTLIVASLGREIASRLVSQHTVEKAKKA